MKKLTFLFVLLLCAALTSCNQPTPPQGGEPILEPSGTVITSPVEESTKPTPAEGEQTATLYIGTKAGEFTEYPMTYNGELTPEKLIQGIADLTGWNLTLAEDVISGMGVCLSSKSALFIGPPDPQKEEFQRKSHTMLVTSMG